MITVREARADDLSALCQVRYRDKPLIHRDRIEASDGRTMQYYVVELAHEIVGFGLLLLERPPTWSDPLESFPILVDLFVAEHVRGQGAGSALVRHMEEAARLHGKPAVYLGVEPDANPRAMQLYLRLGYLPLQAQPYHNTWRFTDSEGVLHEGEEWTIDMWKPLEAST
jgi:GNAT superfamily N-acetyltransferase